MGHAGPAPKRTEERIRRADPTGGAQRQVVVAESEPVADISALSLEERIRQPVKAPEPLGHWCDLVRDLWDSATCSAQVQYWEPTEWHMLRVACESLDRDLGERIVFIPRGPEASVDDVIREEQPLRGASMVAYTKIFTLLGFTEDSRRRMGIEIVRKQLNLEGKGTLTPVAPIGDAHSKRADRLS